MLGEPWIERGRPAWSLDGRVFVHVNPPSLRTAVGLVLSDRADRIVMATMLPGDLNRLWECVTRRRQTPEDMFELVADGLVAHWFGRPRWETERLWDQALGQWASVDGELLRGGVRLETLSPTRATNVVWSLLAKWNFRGEDGEQWLSELTRKPFRQVRREIELQTAADVEQQWEQSMAAFESLTQGGGPSGVDSVIVET